MEHAPLKEGRRWGPGPAYPTPSPSPHAWQSASPEAWPGQVPKAAATLTTKGQATGVVHIEGEDLPIQVPTSYLSFLP